MSAHGKEAHAGPKTAPAERVDGPEPSSQRPTRRGHLFVFEGPDGVGKSSLVAAAYRALAADAIAVAALALPGGEPGTLGAHVYAIHHAPERFGIRHLSHESLQLLHVAAHVDTIETSIRPHLEAGSVVLLDRYWWSTWVYGLTGGVERGVLDAMIELQRHHWGPLRPDTIFLLQRARSLRDYEPAEVFLRRSVEYAALAEREAGDIPVVRLDTGVSAAEALASVLEVIRRRIYATDVEMCLPEDGP